MYTTIKGFYEKGELILEEAPPTQHRVAVIVTFMEEQPKLTSERRPGSVLRLGQSQGKSYKLPENFNESLEDLREYME